VPAGAEGNAFQTLGEDVGRRVSVDLTAYRIAPYHAVPLSWHFPIAFGLPEDIAAWSDVCRVATPAERSFIAVVVVVVYRFSQDKRSAGGTLSPLQPATIAVRAVFAREA